MATRALRMLCTRRALRWIIIRVLQSLLHALDVSVFRIVAKRKRRSGIRVCTTEIDARTNDKIAPKRYEQSVRRDR